MELSFSVEELENVKKQFQINLEPCIQKLLFLEDISSENVFDYLPRRMGELEKLIKETLKPKIALYTYKSLLYYLEKTKLNLLGTENSSLAREELIFLVEKFLCSIDNHICYLVEKANIDPESKKPNIVIFEAHHSNLRTREEVLKIKKTAKANGLNAILRFDTSAKIFKQTLNEFRADYLHFAGHGDGNGDLAFVKEGGGKKFLGFLAFEKYFANEYPTYHPQCKIRNFYLNSCFSNKYANKIHNSAKISGMFSNCVAHIGVNQPIFAVDFANRFYKKEFSSPCVPNSFSKTQCFFAASCNQDRVDYSYNAVLL